MKKRFLILLLIFIFLFTVGCGGSKDEKNQADNNASEDEEVIILRLADTDTPGMPEYEGNVYFTELVEEKTDGKVKVEYYHSSQLGDDKALTPAALAGTIDIVKCSAGNFAEYSKALYFTDIPGLFKNMEHMRAVWQSDIREEIIKQIQKDTGLTPIMFDIDGGAARALAYNGKPIVTPDDMRGFKFRSTGSPIEVALFKAWGAAATPLPWGELYTSLQQKVVDGLYGHPIGIYHTGMVEVIENLTIIDISYITSAKLMSEAAVEKLGGPDSGLYKAVIEAAREAELYKDTLFEQKNKEILTQFEKAGVEVIIPDEGQLKEWRKLAQSIWPEFVGKDVPEELIDRILNLEY